MLSCSDDAAPCGVGGLRTTYVLMPVFFSSHLYTVSDAVQVLFHPKPFFYKSSTGPLEQIKKQANRWFQHFCVTE